MSGVDLLRAVHPQREAFITVGGISAKNDFNVEGFFSLPEPEGKRWKRGVPVWYWIPRVDVVKYLGYLKKLNGAHRHNIYYSVASYTGAKGVNRQGAPTYLRTKDYVSAVQVLWMDFDVATEASEHFKAGRGWRGWPTPNITVNTSPGRLQCLWLLDKPGDPEIIEATLRDGARACGADVAVTDVTRVLRLPGYCNMNRGRYMVTAACLKKERYSLMDFPKSVLPLVFSGSRAPRSARRPPPCNTVCPENLKAEAERRFGSEGGGRTGRGAQRKAKQRWERTYDRTGDKEQADWAVIHYFMAVGVRDADIWMWLVRNRNGRHGDHQESSIRRARDGWKRKGPALEHEPRKVKENANTSSRY